LVNLLCEFSEFTSQLNKNSSSATLRGSQQAARTTSAESMRQHCIPDLETEKKIKDFQGPGGSP